MRRCFCPPGSMSHDGDEGVGKGCPLTVISPGGRVGPSGEKGRVKNSHLPVTREPLRENPDWSL